MDNAEWWEGDSPADESTSKQDSSDPHSGLATYMQAAAQVLLSAADRLSGTPQAKTRPGDLALKLLRAVSAEFDGSSQGVQICRQEEDEDLWTMGTAQFVEMMEQASQDGTVITEDHPLVGMALSLMAKHNHRTVTNPDFRNEKVSIAWSADGSKLRTSTALATPHVSVSIIDWVEQALGKPIVTGPSCNKDAYRGEEFRKLLEKSSDRLTKCQRTMEELASVLDEHKGLWESLDEAHKAVQMPLVGEAV